MGRKVSPTCHGPAAALLTVGGQGVRKPQTGVRNRIIYASWKAGAPIGQLAEQFGLGFSRVKVILADEGYKIAVSPDPIYRGMRKGLDQAGQYS